MAAETCAVCEDSVPFDAAAHVLLNPPDDPVVDGYLCPSCYDEHFDGVLQHAEAPETGGDDRDRPDDADGEPDAGGTETSDPVDADR